LNGRGLVYVLEVDPDLAAGLDQDQLETARRRSAANEMAFGRGPLFFQPPDVGLGALVLEGLILVRVDFAGIRGNIELLGPGDVISPWLGMASEMTSPCAVTARVLTELRVALLDRGFSLRTARWPEIHAALMQRLLARSRMLSMQAAINSVPRIEERIELTLWQLAYRFGRMTRAGIKLHLPLTHTQLAEIVGAQRPSVSTSISRLCGRGRITITARHEWLLLGSPPRQLAGKLDSFVGI
jgi:CRP/FNR family cyclic AMP-dependent transcriptional regulator